MTAAPPRPARFDVPPVWLAGAMALMAMLHRFVPLGQWLQPPATRLGWILIAAGTVLSTSSAFRFRNAGTGIVPFSDATTLVANGAFRWTRNPMYAGLLLGAVGVAVCLGSLSPLAVLPALFLVLDRRFVRREEAFLRARFGADYDAFCRRVRRWL